MEQKPFFSEVLTDRQVAVINHYIEVMGFKLEDFHYIKSQEFMSDLFPVDIAIFGPTEDFNYYTITTVGLSQYKFPKFFARVELSMVMPITWKPIFGKKEYFWAPQLLLDIAYQIVENNFGVQIGQAYLFEGEKENELPYPEGTDAVGGIVCLPEMFPLNILEAEIEKTYTRFFQIMTLDKNAVSKLDEIGPQNYIRFELHDSSNPLMVVPVRDFKPQGIDKIIKKNEDSLKGK